MRPLKEFKNNKYSQFGEDGIICEIFNRIQPKNRCCIEFGAWDGKYLSNTYNLWFNENWNSILIEGDEEKIKLLRENAKNMANVLCLNKYVDSQGENSLENILIKADCPTEPDLLSIDIDGDEYHILNSLIHFKPRILIIEFNPTIPPYLEFVQPQGEYIGASAKSINLLAEKKGYKLITATDTNLFFILKEEFDKLGIQPVSLFDCFPYQHLRNVIEAYDGRKFMNHASFCYSNFDEETKKLFSIRRKNELEGKSQKFGLQPIKIFHNNQN